MPRANIKVQGIKPMWWVFYPVYGGESGKGFNDEWDAYKFAINNRPSRVFVKAEGLPDGLVAEFPTEPAWYWGF